jgi:hypothetical protein
MEEESTTTHDQSMRSAARSLASSISCNRSQTPQLPASRAAGTSNSSPSLNPFPAGAPPTASQTAARTGCQSARRDLTVCACDTRTTGVWAATAMAGPVPTIRRRVSVWPCPLRERNNEEVNRAAFGITALSAHFVRVSK